MTPQTFPTAPVPTPAHLAEARRMVVVERAHADDVMGRCLARRAAWNVLRTDLAQRRTTPTASGGHAA